MHLSDQEKRFKRGAWEAGWEPSPIPSGVAMMRANREAPSRATLYRMIHAGPAKAKSKRPKRGGKPKYFTKARTNKLPRFVKQEQGKSICGLEIAAKLTRKRCGILFGDETLREELHQHGFKWRDPKRAADLSASDKRGRKAWCQQLTNKEKQGKAQRSRPDRHRPNRSRGGSFAPT